MIFIKYVCHTSHTFVLIELLANKYEFIYVVYLFYTNAHEFHHAKYAGDTQ